jgi:hypothetical protein
MLLMCGRAVMTSKDVVVLQNCVDVLEADSGSCNWTCATSRDEDQGIDVKVEVVTDVQEEEDPLLLTSTEHEVRLDVSVFTL